MRSIVASTLMSRFPIATSAQALEDVQSREGALILRLYQMIFGALTKHPAQLRTALQPRLADLVINAVRRLCKSSNPKGHAQVLRACFRALHSGRTTPALQPMFDVFKTVLEPTITLLLVCLRGPSQALPKSTLAELLLMLPANLSDQLSHLKKLVWPLVVALESQEDQIISLGLKTLEFWIDNLNPEFLEMTLAEHFVPILSTLWGHLCPGHIGFSAKALQILGKLGGRSRRLSRVSPGPQTRVFSGEPFRNQHRAGSTCCRRELSAPPACRRPQTA